MAQQLPLEEKKAIQQQLAAYVQGYGSQAKAANSLQGITSPGTLNAIVNGKFNNVSDDMFLRIRAAISDGRSDGWRLCETAAFKDVETFLADAQQYHNVSWIVAPAGIGKTTAATRYAKTHRNVFLLLCSEDMHKADFVEELAKKIGIRSEGLTVRATLSRIVDELVKLDRPLLVFDEGDKLTDSVMYYFISLYNALEDKCGIVFLSTPYIQKRISKGLKLDRKGYEELYSRIGRRFVPLSSVTEYEVNAICRNNGLTDEKAIAAVISDSSELKKSQLEFDLRRVKKSTHKQLRITAASRL
ncbi:MAG: AAA family ATPase [Candidatus Cryptobacteroides sp.]